MARTDIQNERIRNARIDMIKNAALSQFSQKGLFATRISDIAQEAGISQGLIYHYYPSKEQIYAELICDSYDKLIEAVYFLKTIDGTAADKINFAFKSLLQTVHESDLFVQTALMIAQASTPGALPDDFKDQIRSKQKEVYSSIAKIMEEGHVDGTITAGNPAELAILFWTSVNGLSLYRSQHQNDCILPDYRLLAGMFMRNTEGVKK